MRKCTASLRLPVAEGALVRFDWQHPVTVRGGSTLGRPAVQLTLGDRTASKGTAASTAPSPSLSALQGQKQDLHGSSRITPSVLTALRLH